jgi:hypothetical protein
MALMPLTIAIYALAVTGTPGPIECEMKRDSSVVCTNGVTAVEDEQAGGVILTQKGKNAAVKVQAARDGRLLFSNGITTDIDSAGWVRFSSGVAARRNTGRQPGFMVAPDLVCVTTTETKAECRKR